MDWLTFAERFGIPLFILGVFATAVGVFWIRSAWPFLTNTIIKFIDDQRSLREKEREEQRKQREQDRKDALTEREMFLKTLERRDEKYTQEISRQSNEFISALNRRDVINANVANNLDRLTGATQSIQESQQKMIETLQSQIESSNSLREAIMLSIEERNTRKATRK